MICNCIRFYTSISRRRSKSVGKIIYTYVQALTEILLNTFPCGIFLFLCSFSEWKLYQGLTERFLVY